MVIHRKTSVRKARIAREEREAVRAMVSVVIDIAAGKTPSRMEVAVLQAHEENAKSFRREDWRI